MINAMLDRIIRREDILAAFQACSPRLQVVMALRALGYSNQEIAADFGLTREAVDWRLKRAQEQVGCLVLPEVLEMHLSRGKVDTKTCIDCGVPVHHLNSRCKDCSDTYRHYHQNGRKETRPR